MSIATKDILNLLENELRNKKARMMFWRNRALKAATLDDKVAAQYKEKECASALRKMRFNIFNAEDFILNLEDGNGVLTHVKPAKVGSELALFPKTKTILIKETA